MSDYPVLDYLEWRHWVVPKSLRNKPIHRWLVFPHSFTDNIVKALVGEWGLGKDDIVVDPFAGAGTTLVACREKAIPAIGYDLSPLAVLASRVKVASYSLSTLCRHWDVLSQQLRVCGARGETELYPELIRKALPGDKLATLHNAKESVLSLSTSRAVKEFFLLALVSVIPRFSNAVATGGWLSWVDNEEPVSAIPGAVTGAVELMLADLEASQRPRGGVWKAAKADARRLPRDDASCSAAVTSPPYPNRHDYTRVFGVELMFTFLDWEQTRSLRYQTVHSHPEAKPDRPPADEYREPEVIAVALDEWRSSNKRRPRIERMLEGYFLDLYLSLREVSRILRPGGHAAFVVGNAQYDGVPFDVDIATADLGNQAGLICKEIRVVRERGNSAQQMKKYGRNPVRESIVLFQRP